MKALTSLTFFNDAVGMRMSVSYSEVNDATGQVISDNNRKDRVIMDSSTIAQINALKTMAEAFINEEVTNE